MARDDLVEVEGTVSNVHAGGKFVIMLANGKQVTATISGRLRKHHIRIITGDKVTVGISTYDITRGIILSRERVTQFTPR